MSRNIALLTSLSPKFTEETLEIVLEKATGEIPVEVTGWEFAAGTEEGVNYLSQVCRITVSGIVNEKSVSVPVIVKALPQNLCYRKTCKSLDFFRNEITFYTEVIPAFVKFLKPKGACDLLNVPKCLSYLHDGENDFLVLEDVTTRGFSHIAGKEEIWPVENIKIILKGLAQFHGIGLALRHQNPSEFSHATKDLEDLMFSEETWKWYKNHWTNRNTIAKLAMTQHYPGTPEERKYNSITPDQHFENCANTCATSDAPIVVNHGDAWAYNFMIRRTGPDNSDAVIFDFQLARPASVILDISYFLYSCTDRDTRDNHFYDLLKYYHTELGEVIERLGSSIDEVYPESLFLKNVKEQFILGLGFAVDIVPMMVSTEDGLSGMEAFTSNEAVDIAQMWKLNENLPPEGSKRIADIIMHAIHEGFF